MNPYVGGVSVDADVNGVVVVVVIVFPSVVVVMIVTVEDDLVEAL